MLRELNPLETDGRMGFHEPSHTYDLDGKQVPISVTTFLKAVMVKDDDEFDADDIISRNLTKWRSNASSKYYSVVLDKTDEQAAASIKRMWQQTAQMGTKLHALLEDTCNGIAVSTADRIEYATELDQYEHFRHDFDWTPYRTELCVAATSTADGLPALAGSIDALYMAHEETTKTYIVDYKRTPKDLDATAAAFGKYAAHPVFKHRPLNDNLKYACQLATYRILLKTFSGVETHGAFLLQLHKDLPRYQLIPVIDLRSEMYVILQEAGVNVV